jgi:hypothetical protein
LDLLISDFRVLKVALDDDVTEMGIAALAQLKHLQQFLCLQPHENFCNEHKIVFGLCLKLLPHLRVSCKLIRIELENDISDGAFSQEEYQRLDEPLPSALALRQLVLTCPSQMPVGMVLPELETLYLINPRPDFSLHGHSLLTELGLDHVNQQELEQLLTSIGHQLLSLAVSLPDALFVDRVFRMCPKLQKFYITQLPQDFVGLNEPLEDHHECLIEFGFAKTLKYEHFLGRFRPDHLLQILHAVPNLRVWRIKNYWFTDQECELMCEALEQNSILQNLAKVDLMSNNLTLSGQIWPNTDEKVLRCMIDNCPKLCTVKLMRSRLVD